MPYCPRCHSSYPPAMQVCPTCQEKLVNDLPSEPEQRELFATVVLTKVPDEITALSLRSFLLDAGIEAMVHDLSASFFGNVLAQGQGYWGEVIVPKEQEQKAKKLLAEFLHDVQG